MKAKKSLGQHFLKSDKALRTIIETGEIARDDLILEIGPGKGALTSELIKTGVKIIAVEKDDDLFELLKQKFEKEVSSGHLTLVHDDIVNFEPKKHGLKTGKYKLIANIPYNLTGLIIKKFLETEVQPEKIVFLVQKEVAERIIARNRKPFDSTQGKESILSISVKAYGIPKYIETVKAGSFVPAPSVDSAIISIENISKRFFEKINEKKFFNMLHAGFKSKRKKLSSNLSTMFPKEHVERTFEKLCLDQNLRAESVSIETWQKIAIELIGS